MTAIELLKGDHREALNMLEQLGNGGKDAPGGSRMGLFNKLKDALSLHTKLEERVFYPALENFEETRDLIKKSYKEHKEVDELLAQMSDLWIEQLGDGTPNRLADEITPGGDWENRLGELKRAIEDHVDEEENEIFPQAEDLLGQRRLQEMGRQMEGMKRGQSATT